MASGKPKIYWDSCIFLAWLHAEKSHAVGVMEGIEEMAKEINNGRLVLFTSVMTKTEVLENRLTPHAHGVFSNFFKRHNVSMVAQDERVADRSHEIRDYYDKKKVVLSSTDCVHLATAILYNADCFYTIDGSGKRPRRNDLLPLNGNVAGYPLTIQMPHCAQGNLLTGVAGVPTVPPQPGRSKASQ